MSERDAIGYLSLQKSTAKTNEEIALAAADYFVEGMATDLRNGFMETIQNILYDYRDHVLNSIDSEEDSIVDDPMASINLLEGVSDTYVYAERIIEELCSYCIEINED